MVSNGLILCRSAPEANSTVSPRRGAASPHAPDGAPASISAARADVGRRSLMPPVTPRFYRHTRGHARFPSMLARLGHRLLAAVAVVLGVVALTFVLLHS